MNDLISPIAYQSQISFGAFQSSSGGYQSSINRDTFKKELQKSAWRSVFKKLDMERFVTSSVMKDINSFVEKQVNVPFTVNNIFLMMEMIIGTQKQRMERVVVETFDNVTKHHHNNRYQLEIHIHNPASFFDIIALASGFLHLYIIALSFFIWHISK